MDLSSELTVSTGVGILDQIFCRYLGLGNCTSFAVFDLARGFINVTSWHSTALYLSLDMPTKEMIRLIFRELLTIHLCKGLTNYFNYPLSYKKIVAIEVLRNVETTAFDLFINYISREKTP